MFENPYFKSFMRKSITSNIHFENTTEIIAS